MDDLASPVKSSNVVAIVIQLNIDSEWLKKAVADANVSSPAAFFSEAIKYYQSITASDAPFVQVRIPRTKSLAAEMKRAEVTQPRELVAAALEYYNDLTLAREQLASDPNTKGSVLFIGVRSPDGTEERVMDVFSEAEVAKQAAGARLN